MTIPQPLLHDFNAIDDYIQAAREIIREGHMPDMRGLDERVSALCAAIGNAEPEIQQECLSKLSELLDKLDLCEADIRASRATPAKEGKCND